MTNVAGARARVRPRRSAQLPTCARPGTEAGGRSMPPPPEGRLGPPRPPPEAPPAPFPGWGRAAARAQVGDTLTVSSFAGCSGSSAPGTSPTRRRGVRPLLTPRAAAQGPQPGRLRRRRTADAGATRTHTHTRTLTRAPLAHSLHTQTPLLASRALPDTHAAGGRDQKMKFITDGKDFKDNFKLLFLPGKRGIPPHNETSFVWRRTIPNKYSNK